jgi:putative oligomerization/nucleic acid binding protein
MFGASRRVARRTARRTSRRQMAMYGNQGGGYDEGYDEPAPQQSYAPPPAAAPAEPDYVEELGKLARLRDQGIITDEDFEAKKKQILGI